MNITKILALILIVGGILVLIFGIYQFVEFQQSLAGKAASFGNQISKALGGSSRVAKGYNQPIMLMVSGVVAGAIGYFLLRRS
jgi:hypothetical protein